MSTGLESGLRRRISLIRLAVTVWQSWALGDGLLAARSEALSPLVWAEVDPIQSNHCAATTTTVAADSSTGPCRRLSPSQRQSNQHKMITNRLALNCVDDCILNLISSWQIKDGPPFA